MKRITAAALLAALLPLAGTAAEVPARVTEALESMLPGFTPDSVAESVVPGLYEVVIGPHVVYLSADGTHMLRGDVIEVATRSNITESRRRDARLAAIERVPESDMIVFGAADAAHTVTIFTDVDCGYCRKLHNEMDDYIAAGIRVRYLAFPRAGVPSEVYDTMVSVWCADDPREAMTQAKRGRAVPERTCDNPVAREYELGRVLGISGTPTLILDNGDMLPGYVPAARLANMLAND